MKLSGPTFFEVSCALTSYVTPPSYPWVPERIAATAEDSSESGHHQWKGERTRAFLSDPGLPTTHEAVRGIRVVEGAPRTPENNLGLKAPFPRIQIPVPPLGRNQMPVPSHLTSAMSDWPARNAATSLVGAPPSNRASASSPSASPRSRTAMGTSEREQG